MYKPPCELILKVGGNEYDEILTAITSLLRVCSINEQTFFVLERQIHPTAYSGSFTNSSPSSFSIATQSLSCVLLLTDDILKQKQLLRPQSSSTIGSSTKLSSTPLFPKSKHFFRSNQIWNFHHKIELLDDKKQSIARQDYYELSQFLPLWSVSHIPHSRQPIVRFNMFTQHFDSLLTFYSRLFGSQPDSSKPGFALFILPSLPHVKIIYQFSIKYSPSIKAYTIAQSAYLKFRLNNLDKFLSEYTSKLFRMNQSEYYIYDPDGNLLHLQLSDHSTKIHRDEQLIHKSIHHRIDSGMGESSDPSTMKQIFSSTVPDGYRPFFSTMNNKIDKQQRSQADVDLESHSSQSSHDSGRWSSISSTDVHLNHRNKRTTTANSNGLMKTSTPRTKKNVRHQDKQTPENIDKIRLKQQHRQTLWPSGKKNDLFKTSLYDSEPRLGNLTAVANRYYSSMSDVQSMSSNGLSSKNVHEVNRSKVPTHLLPINDLECDVSYEVDSPRQQNNNSPVGYLNAFLMRKKQEENSPGTLVLNNFIEQSDKTTIRRPLSAPLVDQNQKPTKSILHRRPNSTMPPVLNKSPRKRSKSVTFEFNQSDGEVDGQDDFENDQFHSALDDGKIPFIIDEHQRTRRINIGITLDSRLRRTPALDMLRSTAMEEDCRIETNSLNRRNSVRENFVPIARF